MKDKKIISILMSLTMIFVLLGSTLAYVVWGSDEANRTNVVFDIKEGYSCAADGGGDITSNDAFIAPASCTNEKYAIKREVTVSPRITEKGIILVMDLWLDINDIGVGLSESENFRYALTTSSISCDGSDGEVIVSGNFNGKQIGDKIILLEKNVYNKTVNDKYYLYVWLDSEEKSVSTQNQTFSLSLGGSCSKLGAIESPVLDEGMIPVKISDNGIVTTISKDDSNWYDYYNKEWANMVLVDDSNTTTASGEVFDLSGNGNNATYVGAPVYSEQGLVLDGSDDGIFLGNILQDLFKNSNTIQMKVKRNQTGVRDIFIGNYSVSNNINYEVTTGNQYRGYINDGKADLSIGSVKYNEYILYTFIFNKENNKIDVYENSSLVASGSSTQIGSYSYNFTSAYIGRDSRTGATALNGIIERVMVYSDILTEDEISQNVETNFGEIGTENGVVEDNLLLYYDFRNTYRSIDVREHYLNNPGEIISPANILAYYVWIPRYKYKIWTTGVSSAGQEQSIDIEFESNVSKISLGTKVGEYRTHPAFWWDHDNDSEYDEGEMLPGIWVGKFETTGSATQPTVRPNASSLVSQTVSAQFNTSLLFAGGSLNTSTGIVTFSGNNTYGLTDKTNSHMMKNSEWGAAAYLSHSQYGINGEVRINNYYNSGTKTGCGALIQDEATSTMCGISYGSPSTENNTYPQSTTGNITGLFDMSGGAWEYVMGNYNDINKYAGFTLFPEQKYYDKYAVTSMDDCLLFKCGGHALNETKGWYLDFTYFIDDDGPWLRRGGNVDNNYASGLFSTLQYNGDVSDNITHRSVLIPKMNYTVNFDVNGGDEWLDISYTSVGEHEFVVPADGEYQLEVWGAQGGTGMVDAVSKYNGGYGGYAVGISNFSNDTIIYINVGGKGGDAQNQELGASGGYNGGGNGGNDTNYSSSSKNEPGAGGGGATHIALSAGLLSTFTNNQDNLLIVAGGGGGGAYNGVGGSGGGFDLGKGTNDYATFFKKFGIPGEDGIAYNAGSGGGGGGANGGGAGYSSGDSGWGGSGYIENSLLTDKYMYCYNCTTSSEESTLTYTTTNVSSNPVGNYAKSGDGAARIRQVSNNDIVYGYKYGKMPVPTKDGYVFAGWYTEPDGGTRVTKDTIVDVMNNHTLYAHWEPINMNISYSVNGGVIDSSTTNGNTTYNWSTSEDKIYLNGNLYTSNISGLETINLSNYNDSNFMNIIKDGYGAPDGAEWICLFGCKKDNMIFSQDIYYKVSDFCDGSNDKCNIVLGVNFTKKYTITYDVNGGVGEIDSQEKLHGYAINLTDKVPTKELYNFFGWSTDPNATTATYYSESEFAINGDITLYAVWTDRLPLESYSCANGSAGSEPYLFTYTGNCTMIDDGNGNWRLKLLTDGEFTSIVNLEMDVFLVGGGGGGGNGYYAWDPSNEGVGGAGGGGGYTITHKNVDLLQKTYSIDIGSGGAAPGGNGEATYAFDFVAFGGTGGGSATTYNRESAVVGIGGSNGGSGSLVKGTFRLSPGSNGENGQGRTTGEFGDSTATLYAGGGGGGQGCNGGTIYSGISGGSGGGGASGSNGVENTGGGGGGGNGVYNGSTDGASGGSGIVIIRNARDNISGGANAIPKFTYTGMYVIVDEDDKIIGETIGDWKIKFLSSGTLNFIDLKSASSGVDLFMVGGGGGGGNGSYSWDPSNKGSGGGGGGGGYGQTVMGVSLISNNNYNVVVGNGGTSSGGAGGTTSAFNYSANGGFGGNNASSYSSPGAGGVGSVNGGTGSNGKTNGALPGNGIVYEFDSKLSKLYAGGGAGGFASSGGSFGSSIAGGSGGGGASGMPAYYANSGSGGGGGGGGHSGSSVGGVGASGIVIVRNIQGNLPICSLTTDGSTITASYVDNGNLGMKYYGWNSSYSGTSTLSKDISVGTHTYYVMNSIDNKNICQISVEKTVSYTACPDGYEWKDEYASCAHFSCATGKCQNYYANTITKYKCNTIGYTKVNDSYCYSY